MKNWFTRKLDKNKSLLLNSCIFTIGKTTYVDFLPFFNPNSGSELSILRIIIHHKKFELLTHPLCELFLHLKLLRSRSLYWIVIILNFVFTFLTIIYVIWMYGNIGKTNYTSDVWYFMINNLFMIWSPPIPNFPILNTSDWSNCWFDSKHYSFEVWTSESMKPCCEHFDL